MSWSPSKARALPSLRPGQSSPLATSGESTALETSKMPSSSSKWQNYRQQDVTEAQALLKPTSTRARNPNHPRLHTANKPASTSGERKSERHPKEPRLLSKYLEHVSNSISPSPDSPPSASSPTFTPPFFNLTKQELETLRRNMGKGPSYTQFRDMTIARELNRVGRGWGGYLRAKDKAEQADKVEELWQQIRHELDSVMATMQLPPGAISIETAALAAQSNYTTSVGRLKPEPAAEIRWLREGSRSLRSNLPDLGPDCHESSSAESTIVCRPRYSLPVPGADSQVTTVSRPRRSLQRPDYRIQPLPESSPQLSPRTPSPTPRELYDKTKPKFIPYHCEWNRCRAVLNNLETLQKHIRIVHGEEARKTMLCSWGSCGTGTLGKYASVEALEHHFESVHLASLRWCLGDGLKNHGALAEASGVAFSDRDLQDGAQVTP
ncbi:hypothetical protein diail_6166 [Diaporthe ilicicola]|nr:hypothetical protein diail_6166 [Diaporthe ilicicola]